MEVGTSSSLEGKISPNFNSQVENKSSVDNMSVMSKALRNPLILDHILALLNLTDLKMCRLVCRNWAEVGGSLLGKRTFFPVTQLFRYNGSNLYQATPVTQNLMRCITISDKFDPSVPTSKKATVITKIFTDLPHLSQFTREIRFLVNQTEFATAFVNGMRKLDKSATKIQQIDIFVSWIPSIEEYPAYTEKLPFLTSLTSIKFVLHGLTRQTGVDVHGFQPLLQTLLDSAPNLTTLNVVSPYYPNLEGCKNLKDLDFCLMRSGHSRNLDMVDAIGMLVQVKDSLIELKLSCGGSDEIMAQQIENLDVPVMSKLTSLSIHQAVMYLFPDVFNEGHLPALKSLGLGVMTPSEGFLLSQHLNLWKRHRGVKFIDLGLHFLEDANSIGQQIVQVFPAVKKFDLWAVLGFKNSIQEVNEIMTPYRTWDLEEANFRGIYVNASCMFDAVLENMAAWKGVKRVHFEYAEILEDEFVSCIEDLILHSRGFKSVKICGDVVPEILGKIRPILERSGAPIQVTGGVVR